jgi:protein TonB
LSATETHSVWCRDGSAGARTVGTTIVVALHGALVYGLLQLSAVEVLVTDARAVFVRLIVSTTADKRPAASEPPPPAAPRQKNRVTAARNTAPPMSLLPPAAEDIHDEVDVASPPLQPSDPQPVPVSLSSSVPAPAAPKFVRAVSYLRAPVLEYPVASRRMNEQGRVVVRVLIDTQGRAVRVELEQASPYDRLNQAALRAAREALYKPHLEDGVPLVVWALVPLVFELKG